MQTKYLVCAAVLLTAVFFYLYINKFTDIEVSVPASDVSINKDTSFSESKASQSTPTKKSVSEKSDTFEALKLSKLKDLEVFHKDYENRGYFSDEKLNEYGMLSENTLMELAKKGDLLALQTLADLVAFDDLEKSKSLLNEAALYGSTSALIQLAFLEKSNYLSSDKNIDSALKVATLFTAAVKRGDLIVQSSLLDSFYKNHFQPSKEQLKIIDSAADDMLESFNQRRRSIGLSDFDNTPADSMKKLADGLKLKEK